MNTPWLNRAMAVPNSKIEFIAPMRGLCHYIAVLKQPGEPELRGKVALSIGGALENLEAACEADAIAQGLI